MHRHNYQRTEGIRAETTNNALIIVTYTEMLLHLERSYLSNIKLKDIKGIFSCWEIHLQWYYSRFLYCKCIFSQEKMMASALLAENAIFLCSQNNFTLSLNLLHSTGLYLLPWIHFDIFLGTKTAIIQTSFLVPCFPVFTVAFMCVFVSCQHFSRNFIWLLKLRIVWANGDL